MSPPHSRSPPRWRGSSRAAACCELDLDLQTAQRATGGSVHERIMAIVPPALIKL